MNLFGSQPRDKDRIKPFLKQIERIWEANPDLRFGQLIANVTELNKFDPFHMEEEVFLKHIALSFGVPYRELLLIKKGNEYLPVKKLGKKFIKQLIDEQPEIDTHIKEVLLNELVLISK